MVGLNYLLRQLQDIRQGGWIVLSGKMKRRLNQLLLLLNAFWAIPAVWLMRRTRHIFHIRIGTLRSDRIGHFVADAGIQFAKLSEQPMNQIDLYWLPEHTSNKQ